jgi:hypothetical protein
MPAAGMHAASNGRDFGTSRWLLCTTLHQLIIMWKSMESQNLALFGRASRANQCPVSGLKQPCRRNPETAEFDAVDGAHSAASTCHRVVASKRTT